MVPYMYIYIYIHILLYICICYKLIRRTRKDPQQGGTFGGLFDLTSMNSLKVISDLLEGQVVPLLRALQLNTVEKHGVMGAVGGAGHTRPGEICDHDSHLRPEEISQEQGRQSSKNDGS